ncbi:MAG: SpoIID/LytB domain, partial [Frankiales bacterium]|nr:SpoIID/LytB domain [Frankiales bacterium]
MTAATRPTTRTGRPLRCVSVLLSGLLVVLLLPGWAQASDVAGRPADGIVTVDGRGFGHGRGMSQHGAYGAALQGLTYDQILSFYYSGTVLSDAPGARRRVLLTAEDNDAVVSNVPGLTVQAGGVSYRTGDRSDWTLVRSFVDGSALRVHALQGGTWVDVPGLASTAGPVTFSGALLGLNSPAGVRTYRGVLTTSLSGQPGKPLYVVNDVSIDEYVRGVVAAEMPASWHAQALRAQAVAARSYGLQPCPQPGPYPTTALYDVVDTTACQVYGGATAEAATTNQAVADTSGKVLRYGGAVLRTEFSSSNGGWTVAAGGAYVAKEDPYDVIGAQAGRSTVNRWTAVRFGADRLENAFGTGLLTNIQVVARDGRGEWGGRVLKVRLVGAARSVEVTGEQFRSAAGLRSSWFSLVSPIDAKHAQLGGDSGVLGPANGPEQPLAAGGRFRSYRSGAIFWIQALGAHEVHGQILARWGALGWENSPLGYPITDELPAADGTGRYNHFQHGSIYWTPSTGAWSVRGAIHASWARLGYERSALGYPLTDELGLPSGGRYNAFQNGSIYWTPSTGAREVRGAIAARWSALGSEASVLGYPTTDELPSPGGTGRYNDFQHGSIYWTPSAGAWSVRG